jgi:hypothetical protein
MHILHIYIGATLFAFMPFYIRAFILFLHIFHVGLPSFEVTQRRLFACTVGPIFTKKQKNVAIYIYIRMPCVIYLMMMRLMMCDLFSQLMVLMFCAAVAAVFLSGCPSYLVRLFPSNQIRSVSPFVRRFEPSRKFSVKAIGMFPSVYHIHSFFLCSFVLILRSFFSLVVLSLLLLSLFLSFLSSSSSLFARRSI